MNSEKPSTVQSDQMFQRLIKESPFVPGDDGEFLEGHQIEWLNPKLIKEGQEFFERNRFAVSNANVTALLLGFTFKNLTSILLRTGKFTGVEKTMTRFLETEMHLLNWYELDILGENDNGFIDIQRVRKMHTMALKHSLRRPVKLYENATSRSEYLELTGALKKDLDWVTIPNEEIPVDLLTYHPPVLMSQFDMAMTQYGFLALIYLFPDITGIRDKRGMEGFVHLWAVIGRLLGIQDKYNLGLHADRDLFVRIYREIFLPCLIESDMTVISLQKDLCAGIGKVMGFEFGSLRSPLYFSLMSAKAIIPEYEGENLYNIMDWKDIANFRIVQLILYLVYHFDLFRDGINKMTRAGTDVNIKKILGAKNMKKTKPKIREEWNRVGYNGNITVQ